MISFLVVVAGIVPDAGAQSDKKASQGQLVRQQVAAKKEPAKPEHPQTVSLTSVSNHNAFGVTADRRLSIADPTLKALQLQVAGVAPVVSSSGVVGLPKWAYGFSGGKVLLRPTTAPSSGTLYGSGAVGTGTTIMGVGTGERAIGVNGKNPHSGAWFWGSKSPVRHLPFARRDSIPTPF